MAVQCPSCGRFLSAAFVEDLTGAPAPCPRCDTTLTPEMFEETVGEDRGGGVGDSVRPPDLAPARAQAEDPLAGWDAATADVVELREWRRPAEPVPDAAALAGASIVGLVSGLLLARRKGRGAVLGALLGLLLGAVSRRIWELED